MPDLTPFRRSRDLRLVVTGELISNLGTQAALVALPYQLYLVTRSALLVGLLGAVELAELSGWVKHARRLGLICIWAVAAWGVAITAAGLMGSIWLAALLLAIAGGADSVSAVCRSTINQTVTPDAMRGRMSAVFGLVVTGGPRLGDIEAGSVAGVSSAPFSVVSGGLACLAGVALIALAFPSLVRYDSAEWLERTPDLQVVAAG